MYRGQKVAVNIGSGVRPRLRGIRQNVSVCASGANDPAGKHAPMLSPKCRVVYIVSVIMGMAGEHVNVLATFVLGVQERVVDLPSRFDAGAGRGFAHAVRERDALGKRLV